MLQVPQAHAETEKLLAETKAMDVLEAELAAELDFGGISTSQVGYQLGLTVPGCGRTCAELSPHQSTMPLLRGWCRIYCGQKELPQATVLLCYDGTMLCANKVSLHMQAAEGVKRAQRGGMLTGAMLIAIASLLTGATKLQRGIISAAASSREGGQITEDSPIWPIYAPIKVGHSAPYPNWTYAEHVD